MCSFEELCHLFGEQIIAEYKDNYNNDYSLTKNKKNVYTLYKKYVYKNDYIIVARTKKQIAEYIIYNKLNINK